MIRILIIPILLAIAAICAYGTLATLEPGNATTWRIGYIAGIVLCIAGSAATWIITARPKP